MEEFDLNKSNSQTQQKDSFDYDMQKDFFKLTSSFGDQSDDYLNWKDGIYFICDIKLFRYYSNLWGS